jgi:hypothetical protein
MAGEGLGFWKELGKNFARIMADMIAQGISNGSQFS